MIFWDASAIVPLLVAERTTPRIQAIAARDADMLAWWGSEVECVSALARLERAAALDAKGMTLASNRLKQLAAGWHEIEPSEIVRESALRFLRVHPLRAADALQLAAAFIASEHRPASLQLVTLDDRLADAARKEGFALVDVAAG
jgi:predicted nucleic acid-binding protein